MRCFINLDEAWHTIARDLHIDGVERLGRQGLKTIELMGQVFRIISTDDMWVHSKIRKASRTYACAELLWYLSGSNRGTMIEAYAPRYGEFLVDGVAYGAYGKRWADYGQFKAVIQMLREAANTRQTVMSTWHPGDAYEASKGGVRDLPCTLSLQFILRDGKLNLVTTMRSNDWWLGMPYDVWCFSRVQKMIAAAVKVDTGWYQHQVGSLHVYGTNFSSLYSARTEDPQYVSDDLTMSGIYDWESMKELISTAVQEETRIRETKGGRVRPEIIQLLGGDDALLSHAVLQCARKWETTDDQRATLDR
jgi:thymidylate synthase